MHWAEKKAEAIEMLRKKVAVRVISEKLYIPYATIRLWKMSASGIPAAVQAVRYSSKFKRDALVMLKRMSAKKAAERLGITCTTLCKWKRNMDDPDPSKPYHVAGGPGIKVFVRRP